MLHETLPAEPDSQKWRQLFVILLCAACAISARIFIHWSCTQASKALQDPGAESAPSAQVEQGTPGRRF
jgi:hypothetical protein